MSKTAKRVSLLLALALSIATAAGANASTSVASKSAVPLSPGSVGVDTHDRALVKGLLVKTGRIALWAKQYKARLSRYGDGDDAVLRFIADEYFSDCGSTYAKIRGLIKRGGLAAVGVVLIIGSIALADGVRQSESVARGFMDAVVAMRPHAPVFRAWVSKMRRVRPQLYRVFDAFIAPQYCSAARLVVKWVRLDRDLTRTEEAQLWRGFGIDKRRFDNASREKSVEIPTELKVRFRAFLIGAGVSRRLAEEISGA